jgi:hypothetical protein
VKHQQVNCPAAAAAAPAAAAAAADVEFMPAESTSALVFAAALGLAVSIRSHRKPR